ncbi:hypothetical protein DFJ77DRAFT_515400 [Powellomyces hirtus]|nr:hypothetical protein DFJ77DRAFT_515400 [Powellomyces hirtus]
MSNWASRIMHRTLDSAREELQSENEGGVVVMHPAKGELAANEIAASNAAGNYSDSNFDKEDEGSRRQQARPKSAEPREHHEADSYDVDDFETAGENALSAHGSVKDVAHGSQRALPGISSSTNKLAKQPGSRTASNHPSALNSRLNSTNSLADAALPPLASNAATTAGTRPQSSRGGSRVLSTASSSSLHEQRAQTTQSEAAIPSVTSRSASRSNLKSHPSDKKLDPKDTHAVHIVAPKKAPRDELEMKRKKDATGQSLVLQLRNQVAALKQQLGERENAIDLLRSREAELRAANAMSPRAQTNHPLDKEARILYDRQKKAYQILVQKLRREVRRLRFQRNSLADPLIETNYFPYLPRTVDGVTARSLTRTAAGATRSLNSDYFAMNPPPATGNHPESGNRWWWGSGPNLSEHLPRPKTAPIQTSRNLHSARHQQPAEANFQAPGDAVACDRKLGDRVAINIRGQPYLGTLTYVGTFEAHPETGIWCGVALDLPVGKHDGIIQGKRYFTCEPSHGLFVKWNKTLSLRNHGEQPASTYRVPRPQETTVQ